MIGFDKVHKALPALLGIKADAFDTSMFKAVARAMYIIGGMDLVGKFDATETPEDIARVVREFGAKKSSKETDSNDKQASNS